MTPGKAPSHVGMGQKLSVRGALCLPESRQADKHQGAGPVLGEKCLLEQFLTCV